MKLNLKKHQLDKIEEGTIEFKKEGLGALEFTMKVVDSEFEEKEVQFRIERVSPQTYLKIGGKEKLENMVPETIKNFIALPVEARDLDFFKFDTEALNVIGTIAGDFQNTPLAFRKPFEELKGLLSD